MADTHPSPGHASLAELRDYWRLPSTRAARDRARKLDLTRTGKGFPWLWVWRAEGLRTIRRIVPRAERHLGLVDLDEVLQKRAVGVDHRALELLQQEPGRLAAAEAELPLEVQRRDTAGMARHDLRGQEPRPQRQVASVQDRACEVRQNRG